MSAPKVHITSNFCSDSEVTTLRRYTNLFIIIIIIIIIILGSTKSNTKTPKNK